MPFPEVPNPLDRMWGGYGFPDTSQPSAEYQPTPEELYLQYLVDSGLITSAQAGDLLFPPEPSGGYYGAPSIDPYQQAQIDLQQQANMIDQQMADDAATRSRLDRDLEKYMFEKNLKEQQRVQNEILKLDQRKLNLEQQRTQIGAQLDWYNSYLAQRGQDIGMRGQDIDAAMQLIGYQLQQDQMEWQAATDRGDYELAKSIEERMRYTEEMGMQLQEQALQIGQRETDVGAITDMNKILADLFGTEAATQLGKYGIDVNALMDMNQLQGDTFGQLINQNLGLGELGLGMAEEDRMRAQMGIDAQLQYGNQQLQQWGMELQAAQMAGDWAQAQDIEDRMRAQMQQNAALEQASLGLQGYATGVQGQTAAAQVMANLAGIEEQRAARMSEDLANPRDWIQMARSTGGGTDFLTQLTGGQPITGQNLGTGSLLGESWDAYAKQAMGSPAFDQAMQGAKGLQEFAGQVPDIPSMDFILGLGDLGPQSQMPQLPGGPTLPGWESLMDFYGNMGELPGVPSPIAPPNFQNPNVPWEDLPPPQLQNPQLPWVTGPDLTPNWGELPGELPDFSPTPINYTPPPQPAQLGVGSTAPPGGYSAPAPPSVVEPAPIGVGAQLAKITSQAGPAKTAAPGPNTGKAKKKVKTRKGGVEEWKTEGGGTRFYAKGKGGSKVPPPSNRGNKNQRKGKPSRR